MRAAGKKLGVVTLILDAAKGFLPVVLATVLGVHVYVIALVGLAAFLGHVFPVFLRFKGGKGVATALGVYLAVSPVTILGAFVVFVIVAAIWRYVSLASMIGAMAVPIGLYLIGAPGAFVIMAVLITLVVILRHKDNITRLAKGTESKLSSKKCGRRGRKSQAKGRPKSQVASLRFKGQKDSLPVFTIVLTAGPLLRLFWATCDLRPCDLAPLRPATCGPRRPATLRPATTATCDLAT